MNTLGKGTVVVYADTNTDGDAMPDVVKEAVRTPEAGKYIPKTVIVDREMSEVVAIVPYSREEGERKKLFAGAIKKMREYSKGSKKRDQKTEDEDKSKDKDKDKE